VTQYEVKVCVGSPIPRMREACTTANREKPVEAALTIL
jgi:hypothetical protein